MEGVATFFFTYDPLSITAFISSTTIASDVEELSTAPPTSQIRVPTEFQHPDDFASAATTTTKQPPPIKWYEDLDWSLPSLKGWRVPSSTPIFS
jgi:hypothetical protein